MSRRTFLPLILQNSIWARENGLSKMSGRNVLRLISYIDGGWYYARTFVFRYVSGAIAAAGG